MDELQGECRSEGWRVWGDDGIGQEGPDGGMQHGGSYQDRGLCGWKTFG